MSKDVNSYRPTSFSSRINLGEPMTTRGIVVSTNTSDDSNEGSDDSQLFNVETFLKENPLNFNIAGFICRLPQKCSLLTSPESLDCLNMTELISVASALKIIQSQQTIQYSKSRRSRENIIKIKTKLLTQIAEKFGEQWLTLHDCATDIKNANKSTRRKKPTKVSSSASFSTEISEIKLSGAQSGINQALSCIQSSKKMPSRDELIYLTDAEYESAKSFYHSTHSEIVDLKNLPSGNSDVTILQQILSSMRESTSAQRICLQHTLILKKLTDKINEQKTKSSNFADLQNLSSLPQESDSSD